MACQTGIKPDAELKKFFEDCKREKVRLAKFVINKERIAVNFHTAPSKDWKKDWSANLPNCVDSYEPCFILFRVESNHDWVLISFADDKASIKDKMLLAATKATFKNEFGVSFIRHDVQVSNKNELTLDKIEKKLAGPKIESAPANAHPDLPYTHIERELSTVAKDKINLPQPQGSKALLRGVQFPVDQDAIELLKQFSEGNIDFVQLSVDTLNEAIKLESHKNQLNPSELNANISRQKPRYTFYRLREVDGEPVFFIYSVPPSASCTIKELMLFSSCKAPFVSEVENVCGVKVTKKIEVDSREKLDADALSSYVRPVVHTEAAPVVRPPRPGGGPRRLPPKVAN
ncbi:unnamed protein product [Bursaphelenchus xylophilus]|uniref:Twinfilin n=1 Tax=Bursaphelenchus xylophilus TaxID=6326 RepID=A0A1I7RI66_BURXY|nr:unnamed protein product [Bursaphelenchus xylophilus]CAG9115123.1 unnamed protein product [Bursaphelenchus xylophilus]